MCFRFCRAVIFVTAVASGEAYMQKDEHYK